MRPAGVSRAVDAVLRRPYGGAISRSFRAAMTIEADMQLAYLRDPRLAAHALSPMPAWLWREDARQILWANPAGGSIFGAASPGMLAAMRFDSGHSAAAQVKRVQRRRGWSACAALAPTPELCWYVYAPASRWPTTVRRSWSSQPSALAATLPCPIGHAVCLRISTNRRRCLLLTAN